MTWNAKRALLNLAVVGASTFVALLAVEMGLRIANGKELFSLRNFAADDVNQQISNIAIVYDPVIGYYNKPDRRGGANFTTGAMGVHLNHTLQPGDPSPPLPTGGILAVGDSFVFGSEANDDESWPAYLEQILGVPVVNGAAGGYGYDQAILRAEQLIDLVKPRLIIVGCIPNCNARNNYSVNSGLVKPYFDIAGDKLVLRNVPVPDYAPSKQYFGWPRFILGHLYLSTWAAERLGYGSRWKYSGKYEIRQEHDYDYKVTCLLWKRLADRVAGQNIRLITIAQYSGLQTTLYFDDRRTEHVEETLECARKNGIVAIDSFPELRKRLEADPHSFWNLWTREPNDEGDKHTGHMSKEGNRFTAELLASTIRTEMPEVLGDAKALDPKVEERRAEKITP